MAPPKSLRTTTKTATLMPLARKGISKRSQNIQDQNMEMNSRGKRKADNSPLKNEKIKRSALGNLTNNVNTMNLDDDSKLKVANKVDVTKKITNALKVKKENANVKQITAHNVIPRQTKIVTRASTRNAIVLPLKVDAKKQPNTQATVVKKKDDLEVTKQPTRRISNEFNKTEESLYMSALEDISTYDSIRFSGNFEAKRRSLEILENRKSGLEEHITNKSAEANSKPLNGVNKIPQDVIDFDKENWLDPFQVSEYAMDIFNYLKERETNFVISDYMDKQTHLSKWMRSLLVDWMVEVQETFELNHETLYLAVKLVDMYLCKVLIHKDKLQLLGAAALFIACKFDERTPPLVDDFLYICDGAYNHDELIKMEMNVLKVIDFDLGIPISYRFLRRYARVAKISMPTLTLARYILEFSLMDYSIVGLSDSKLACAALFMALRMHKIQNPWSSTLQYYTGYELADFTEVIPILNSGLHRKPKDTIKTIRNKYSHKIFHEVAKVALLNNESMIEDNLKSLTT